MDLIYKDSIALEVLNKYKCKADIKKDYIISLCWLNSYFDIPADDLEIAVLESGIADYTYELIYEDRILSSDVFPNLKYIDSNPLHDPHSSSNIVWIERDEKLYIYANDTLLLEAVECRGFDDDNTSCYYMVVFIDDIIKCKLGETSDEIFLLNYDIVMFVSWIKSIMPYRTKSAKN